MIFIIATTFYIFNFFVYLASSEKEKIRSALRDIMNAASCLNFKEFQLGSAPIAHVDVTVSYTHLTLPTKA